MVPQTQFQDIFASSSNVFERVSALRVSRAVTRLTVYRPLQYRCSGDSHQSDKFRVCVPRGSRPRAIMQNNLQYNAIVWVESNTGVANCHPRRWTTMTRQAKMKSLWLLARIVTRGAEMNSLWLEERRVILVRSQSGRVGAVPDLCYKTFLWRTLLIFECCKLV